MITAEQLRSQLDYNPMTGIFKWKVKPNRRIKIGDVAGANSRGYVTINVLGRQYSAHRLAWLYITGRMPTLLIDHINGERADNRFFNLREATHQINCQNQRRPRSTNKTGFLGVMRYHKAFVATLMVNRKTHKSACFESPDAAHQEYVRMKRKLHTGCTL